MSKTTFLKEMIKLHGMPWLILFSSLILIAAVMAALVDIKWIIVALMILCILSPMMIAFFYIYYGMRPVTVLNILPHTLNFNRESIIATLYSVKRNTETGDREYSEVCTHHLPYSELKKYKCGLTSIIIPFCGEEKGFIWLPVSAFEDSGSFTNAIDRISTAVRDTNNLN